MICDRPRSHIVVAEPPGSTPARGSARSALRDQIATTSCPIGHEGRDCGGLRLLRVAAGAATSEPVGRCRCEQLLKAASVGLREAAVRSLALRASPGVRVGRLDLRLWVLRVTRWSA
eukprot:scaffold1206_cov388-Prasinococcus_capsulatus_cf.AAC.26